jgi:hypothetical protein
VSDPSVTEIERFEAPYRREIVLQDVVHESGLRLLRIRIREGHRFTILDVDAPTAELWAGTMLAWCRRTAEEQAQ